MPGMTPEQEAKLEEINAGKGKDLSSALKAVVLRFGKPKGQLPDATIPDLEKSGGGSVDIDTTPVPAKKQQMATSITKFEDAFKYSIIHESACDNVAIENVTSEPGSIYSISLTNPHQQDTAYFKFFDTADVTMGTTVAEMVLKIPGASTYVYEMPTGVPFDSFSFACTKFQNPADNTAPSATISVKIVTS